MIAPFKMDTKHGPVGEVQLHGNFNDMTWYKCSKWSVDIETSKCKMRIEIDTSGNVDMVCKTETML